MPELFEGFWIELLCVLICLAFWPLGAFIFHLRERKKVRGWSSFAEDNGFQFERNLPDIDFASIKLFESIPNTIKCGLNRRRWLPLNRPVRCLITGQIDNLKLQIASWYVGGRTYTLCHLSDPRVNMASFLLQQHNNFRQDDDSQENIEFNEDTEFSMSFVLQGSQEPTIRIAFGPRTRNSVLEFSKKVGQQGFCMEAHRNSLVIQCTEILLASELRELVKETTVIWTSLKNEIEQSSQKV